MYKIIISTIIGLSVMFILFLIVYFIPVKYILTVLVIPSILGAAYILGLIIYDYFTNDY